MQKNRKFPSTPNNGGWVGCMQLVPQQLQNNKKSWKLEDIQKDS